MAPRAEQPDVEPHLGVLRRYALVLTRSGDEAEDLVQEALVRAMAAAHTWRPSREVRPWLLAILHNVHVSRRRRQQVEAAWAREQITRHPRRRHRRNSIACSWARPWPP